MSKLKYILRKYGGVRLQNLIIWFLITFKLNNKFILFSTEKAKKNRVNINYWKDVKNLGDILSPVIVNEVLKRKNIDSNKKTNKTAHLFAIGSIIVAGYQDCTIWGSGLLNVKNLNRLKNRKLDIRAVRGPITRAVLMDEGFDVPEVYGDPAVLLPLFFNPEIDKKFDVGIITHLNNYYGSIPKDWHKINIITDDYENFVKEIKSCKLIISSSLHGIILSEVYGIPAVLLKPQENIYKYYDYYFSTGRFKFPIADSVQQAINVEPTKIPDFSNMQNKLLISFPYDLWEA